MIDQAIAILQQAGFDLTARELAEIIWLAVHIESEQSQHQPTISEKASPRTDQPQTLEIPEPCFPQLPEPSAKVYLPSFVPSLAKSRESREAIPIKVSRPKSFPEALPVLHFPLGMQSAEIILQSTFQALLFWMDAYSDHDHKRSPDPKTTAETVILSSTFKSFRSTESTCGGSTEKFSSFRAIASSFNAENSISYRKYSE